MTAGALIAVPVALEDACSGAIIYWRLSGDVHRATLEREWIDRGLEDHAVLPSPTSCTAALKRAMANVFPTAMVRPLRGEFDGYVTVFESYDADGKPRYQNGCEARFVTTAPGVVISGASDLEVEAQIQTAYLQHLATLSQSDIGGWLVSLAHIVQAVRLRDTGGIYFVPRQCLALWREFVSAIRATTKCELFEIPAMNSGEAMTSIVDALTRESQEAVCEMRAELDAFVAADTVSNRVVKTRTRRLDELSWKLGSYEELLGAKLVGLRAQLEDVQARLAEAALMVDAYEA